ncbi:hypothetical protein AVEN_153499-1 [Araneus ventricosus]|uniref:THAP-type domain-containing protein n=1 Tax=Araneus ventricosus TaxID=182803 RepID=A0A4Y2K4C5_ARAVE|nr:hypothetical protein AVEN_153499-1 [Araneus ventricosus]
MDATAENAAFLKIKYRNRGRTCSLQNEWFSALKWNSSPEKLKYVLGNARVCDRHFSESCFSCTLREGLNKFPCPQITEDLASTASDNLSALPSPASQYPSVEVIDTEQLLTH